VCAITVNNHELLASTSDDHTIRLWDPTGTLQQTLTGHTDRVNSVCAITVNNHELLASTSDDHTIRLWDPTGTLQQTLTGHTDRVNSVCAITVNNHELLASTSDDRTVRLWDPATGRSGTVIPIPYPPTALTKFDDNSLLIGISSGILALCIYRAMR
jgi:WD40 repeat protein